MKHASHVYIHIPFCVKKCSYCSFYSLPFSTELAENYLSGLEKEIELRLKDKAEPETIYIGGGTPTSLSETQLLRLFKTLSKNLSIAPEYEFTTEINPGTLSKKKIEIIKKYRINRISLGVQSFLDKKLNLLGRIHNASEATETFKTLRNSGFSNINIDLIYGAPGDKMTSWQSDLKIAAELEPEHVSVYCLSVETGTPLQKMVSEGNLRPLDENLQKEMYYAAIEHFESAGWEHYEISNFAKGRNRSRHNLATWEYKPYIGLGPSAVSFDGLTRIKKVCDLKKYRENPLEYSEIEELTPLQKAGEVMMLALRTRDGITREEFFQRTGLDITRFFGDKLNNLINENLVEIAPQTGAFRLKQKALFVSDEVLVEFF